MGPRALALGGRHVPTLVRSGRRVLVVVVQCRSGGGLAAGWARGDFFSCDGGFRGNGDAALLRTVARTNLPRRDRETQAVLSKALATAPRRASSRGVSKIRTGRPGDPRGRTEHGCDLIVMAPVRAGVAGWLHSSQTERVLRRASIAVLVTRWPPTIR